VAVIVVILFSCVSSGSIKTEVDLQADVMIEIDIKKNNTPSSMLEQFAVGYWVTRPMDNVMTVIGVSNPMLRRNDEIAAAKEDAARKVAMYHGIEGNIETTLSTGTNFFDHLYDYKVELEYDPDYSKYIDHLMYDPQQDVLATDEAVFVRFQYKAEVVHIDYITDINATGRPNWIYNRNMPQLDGFITATGYARNQLRLKDTVFKATESAAARMIEDMSTQIQNKTTVVDQFTSDIVYAVSMGKLSHFHVIEFWIDPDSGYVYTLAIARPMSRELTLVKEY
jgi:hypothetical protein